MDAHRPDRRFDILLVEDNPGEARLIGEVLRAGPVPRRLSLVPDGATALAFLRREGPYGDAPRPDLILLDLHLPQQPGHAVVAAVKAAAALKAIPVLVLTASEDHEAVAASYRLGANCHIVKPFDLDQFLACIRGIEDFRFGIAALPER